MTPYEFSLEFGLKIHRTLVIAVLTVCPVFLNSVLHVGNAQTKQTELPVPQSNADQLTAVKLFASDRITDVEIEIEPAEWEKLRLQTRSFSEALTKELPKKVFTYFKGDVRIDGQLIKNVGIRKKGLIGSLNVERPSLKIKFSEYVEQDPVEGLDRLTLNNNNQDPGRICQYLSYKLFRDSGTHAPRCGFARVSVNGKYLGIYSNVEPIKSDFLKHSFGESSGALYEGTITDFYPEFVEKFEKKNKKAKTKYVQAVADALSSEDMNDRQLEELEKLVDVDSFLKYWAMESMIGFWDSYCSNQNNYYIYRASASKQFYFIPWGADSAFTESSPIPPFFVRPKSVHSKSLLTKRLYKKESVRAKYKTTLMSILEKNWDEEKLVAEIDRLEKLLEQYVMEENDGFEGSLKKYRRFVKSRRKAIVREFEEGAPEINSAEQRPMYMQNIGTAEATFSTRWYDRDPGKVGDGEELELTLFINGKTVELEGAYVYAKTDDRNKDNSTIIITGKSKSNGKQTIIAAGLPTSEFLSKTSGPRTGGGAIIQAGMLGMMSPKFKMMFGELEFEKASTQKGEPVKGRFKMTIGEFKGG